MTRCSPKICLFQSILVTPSRSGNTLTPSVPKTTLHGNLWRSCRAHQPGPCCWIVFPSLFGILLRLHSFKSLWRLLKFIFPLELYIAIENHVDFRALKMYVCVLPYGLAFRPSCFELMNYGRLTGCMIYSVSVMSCHCIPFHNLLTNPREQRRHQPLESGETKKIVWGWTKLDPIPYKILSLKHVF